MKNPNFSEIVESGSIQILDAVEHNLKSHYVYLYLPHSTLSLIALHKLSKTPQPRSKLSA